MVRRELEQWFVSLSDGAPRLDRGLPNPRDPDLVRRVFFTDANGCIARAAWERVPFRDVGYAEDHVLARDMLAAGYAVTVPVSFLTAVRSATGIPTGLWIVPFESLAATSTATTANGPQCVPAITHVLSAPAPRRLRARAGD